jgi:uncharacterized protein (TIGR00290 family)
MDVIASWSGGKDSCLACYKAISAGYKVRGLVNFISKQFKRVSFHGVDGKLIQLQGDAIGLPVFQKETTGEDYEQAFKEVVRTILSRQPAPNRIEGMVFGDIYIQEHRDWVERVCAKLGISAIEPLWGEKPEDIVSSFIEKGFEAIVVSAKAELIEKEWIGHNVDKEFLEYLKKKNICPCGEGGEYHTFVTNGAIFKMPVKVRNNGVVLRDSPFGSFWFLDIKEA